MKKMYGLFAIGGFMITMLCFVLTRKEVTKLELSIIFLAWIMIEVVITMIGKWIHHFLQMKKREGVETPARFRIL